MTLDKLFEARGMLHTLSFTEKDPGKYDAIEHALTLIDEYIEQESKRERFEQWGEIMGKMGYMPNG